MIVEEYNLIGIEKNLYGCEDYLLLYYGFIFLEVLRKASI
jgi:hypothetical protein